MTSNAANMSARPLGRKPLSGTFIVGLFWVALLGLQLVRTMWIDAYELTQSRFDLLGYWLAFASAFMLGLRMLDLKRMMVTPVVLVFLLIFYTTLVHLLTAPTQSHLAFLVSRYGVVMWFVLGVGFTAVLDILQGAGSRHGGKRVRQAILAMLGVLAIFVVLFAQEIILSPVQTMSYQSVASSATILLLMFTSILIVVWGKSIPVWLAVCHLGFAMFLAAAVALLQSTLIVAVWLGLFLLFFGQQLRESPAANKLAIVVVGVLALSLFVQTGVFDSIMTTTRFAVFSGSESGEFTSLTSRLEILETFMDQFRVSPIFGHYEAELVVGGDYVHSLPLSFLTHTGLIGAGLVTTALFILLRSRSTRRPGLDPSEWRLSLLMQIVIGLGTISSFLTWAPFWFMLGVMCRRPIKLYRRPTKSYRRPTKSIRKQSLCL